MKSDCEILLENRINHCKNLLVEKMKVEQVRNEGNFVFFEDGRHFSKITYRNMVHALRHKPEDKWDALIWQQIAKQAYSENRQQQCLFNIIMEELLISSYREVAERYDNL